MVLWNEKVVSPPPVFTFRMNIEDINLSRLETVCSSALVVLSSQQPLHTEAATFSRVLYRLKSKLRRDKGFKYMEKVNRGLRQYLAMDLYSVYSTFSSCVPRRREATVYLPTRQMLEWLLVRTQGFARLFCNVACSCSDAALFLHLHLNRGHAWTWTLLTLSLVSRIWCIAKYLVTCACEWYSKLKPFLDVLVPSGQQWLPPDYTFPENLVTWLDAERLLQQPLPKVQKSLSIIDKILASGYDDTLLGDEALDLSDEEGGAVVKSAPSTSGSKSSETEVSLAVSSMVKEDDPYVQQSAGLIPEDVGELISRRAARKRLGTKIISKKTKIMQHDKPSSGKERKISQSVTEKEVVGDSIKYIKSEGDLETNSSTEVSHNVKVEAVRDSSTINPKSNKNYIQSGESGLDPVKDLHFTADDQAKSNKKHSIENIRTCSDLKSFLAQELRLREEGSEASYTRNLDKLQWNMFYKAISMYVVKLQRKDVKKNKQLNDLVMKKVRKAIKLRVL